MVPTISNLVTRGLIPNSLNCVHCSTPIEDIKHASFLCDWVRDIWDALELNNLTNQVVDISIEEMLGATKESKSDKFELMLMLMWQIWCARNSKAHIQGNPNNNKVKEFAYRKLQELTRVNQSTEVLTAPRHAPLRAWFVLTHGVNKINCDAGVLGNERVSGFVMRCHNGLVLVARRKHVAFETSVVIAEAKAILWAIQVAQAKGYARAVLETNLSIWLTLLNTTKCYTTLDLYFFTFNAYSFCSTRVLGLSCDANGTKLHELAGLTLTDNVDELRHLYTMM